MRYFKLRGQKDETIRPDGRQKARKENKRPETQELKTRKRNKTSVSVSSWLAKDETRDPKEGRDGG